MAAGDILAVAIGAEGWYADVTIEGVGTGGTYDLGLGQFGDPDAGAPTLSILVTSMGFDDTGSPITVTRTVYGTKQVRKPFPNAGERQETAAGGNVTVRVALSDYVYAKDKAGAGNAGTDPVATLRAGLYTQGGTASKAAASVPVANNSTWAYPKVVGNWSWPAYEKRGATFKLSAIAMHSSAQQGRPVRCVRFTATDGTNTASTIVTEPVVDSSRGDAMPVVEYVATMSAANLTQGAVLTENFQAFPWIGDAASVLDTSTGTPQPTPLFGPARSVCDKTGAYAQTFAIVDTAGNDATGGVGVDLANPPAPFATIAGALTALRNANSSLYARNNPGGSTVYLRAGNHAWIGGTYTAGTTPDAWVTITRFPGLAVGNVTISGASGGKAASARALVRGVTWTAQSASGAISGQTHLWVDQCNINAPVANQPPFYVNTVWYMTRCTITALNQGLRPFSTTNAAPAIIRGNTSITGAQTGSCRAYMTVGNLFTNTFITDFDTAQTIPAAVSTVVAFNKLKQTTAAAAIVLRQSTVDAHGGALVQNLVESLPAGAGPPAVQVCADSTVQTPVDNQLIWHNTVIGQRANLAYNEVDTAAGGGLAWRRGWSMKNNLWDDVNIKTDTFAGSGFAAEGTKIGNWSVLYGAGCSGQLNNETTGIGAAGTFCYEFPGIRSDQSPPHPTTQPLVCATRPASYPQFVDRESYDGGASAGLGDGDYRLAPTSPSAGLQRDLVLKFDLAAVERVPNDASGVYVARSGGTLGSAGFFALIARTGAAA